MSELTPYVTAESDEFQVTTNSPDAAPETPEETTAEPETAAERDARGRFSPRVAKVETAETDEEPQPEAKADTEKPAEKPPKRSLNRLIWEREEAERKAKAADERAAKLEAELAAARRPPERREPVHAPTEKKFTFAAYDAWSQEHPDGSYEDYIEERLIARQRHERAAEEQARTVREHQERLRTWGAAHRAREIEARRQYADYDQRLTEAQDALTAAGYASLPPALGRAILESDHSARITYDLATHPEVALQLAREADGLPESAAPWMRRVLESRLSAASSGPAEPPKVTSSAKPVIKPVIGTPAQTDPDDVPDDDEPFERFLARENARDRKAGRW